MSKMLRIVIFVMLFFFVFSTFAMSVVVQDIWPKRVLITNDDGIEEEKLGYLAAAFSKVAETYVFASYFDRSGSSNYLSLGKYQLTLEARLVASYPNLKFYAVNGFPADCVMLGLLGVLRDNPPDIVISGINGGTNEGHEWFGSGTIGAARMAAFAGIPAIAFSGLDDDDEAAVEAVNAWAVRLAQSSIARSLKPGQYLTVSFPRIPPDQIKGVRIARRSSHTTEYSLTKAGESAGSDVWIMHVRPNAFKPEEGTDSDLLSQGYIVIVPMSVDEHDYQLLKELQNGSDDIPAWKPGR